jgi:predicted AlkP superfamily pyrophosphatase or phosphodiesterase
MIRMLVSGGAFAVTMLGAPYAGAQERLADHVIMVSVDGLRPEFYLDERWPAPVMQRLAAEGAHARGVRSVFPSVTYAAHTTLVTGALPARHGIYYNLPFEPAGQTGRWSWEYDAIQVETLWDAVAAAGLTSAAVSWPVGVGAPIDWSLPEFWSLDPEVPFMDALRTVERPEGWLAEVEREATGRLIAYDSTGTVDRGGYHWWDGRKADIAEYVIGTRRPNFMAIHLTGTDGAQHSHGREHRDVDRAVAAADHFIGLLVEATERAGLAHRTTFLIVGDHGFIDYDRVLHPNVWLVEAGLTGDWEDRGDWRAAFHVAGGAATLRLRDADDREALAQVRAILASQPESVRALYRVLEADELQSGGADPNAPLALTAARGVAFNPRSDRDLVVKQVGGTHGYWPDFHQEIYTGFVAWGAGVVEGVRVDTLGIERIGPTAAALLGLRLSGADATPLEVLLRQVR